MDTWVLCFLLLQSVFQYPQPVGDGLDEVSRLRMEAYAKLQEEERIRLEREVEQLSLQQGVWGWGDLLCSALTHWQLWAAAGLLLLLLALAYTWRKRSLRRQESEEGNDGANEEEAGGDAAANVGDVGNEEEAAGNEGEGNHDIDGEENNHADGNAEEVDNAAAAADAANEDGDVGNGAGNEVGNEMAERDPDDDIGWRVMQRIQWPDQDLRHGCEWTRLLMFTFAIYFRRVVSGTFYPVLQRAIGVGSAFEGWSPREQDVVYQVLIPMAPPPGHSFHLELEPAGQRCVRNFRVRVRQECTCGRQGRKKKMLCFLHHPKERLRRNQADSLLDTLCTDSYLDVEKTARWFYQLVRAIWPAVLQSHCWHLVQLPSRRSCQFKVTNGTDSYRIEMLFGVRQGNSDIFVSSQPNPAWTSSTTWPESYAVAEMKFFQSIARRAPPDSLHLQCLQFFTRLTLGFGFSTYTIKTIVMYMLSVLPVSLWRRRHFVTRLRDISESLRTCVEERRLNHFIVGNPRLPEDISLPPELLVARTCNLFHDLAVDPLAHSQALYQYMDLQQCLDEILNNED